MGEVELYNANRVFFKQGMFQSYVDVLATGEELAVRYVRQQTSKVLKVEARERIFLDEVAGILTPEQIKQFRDGTGVMIRDLHDPSWRFAEVTPLMGSQLPLEELARTD